MKRISSSVQSLLMKYCPSVGLNDIYQYNPINKEDLKSINTAKNIFFDKIAFKKEVLLLKDQKFYYLMVDAVFFTIPIVKNDVEESFNKYEFSFSLINNDIVFSNNSASNNISKELKYKIVACYLSMDEDKSKHHVVPFIKKVVTTKFLEDVLLSHEHNSNKLISVYTKLFKFYLSLNLSDGNVFCMVHKRNGSKVSGKSVFNKNYSLTSFSMAQLVFDYLSVIGITSNIGTMDKDYPSLESCVEMLHF